MSYYRGLARAQQQARAKRADREARLFDLTTDPAVMSDAALVAAVYRCQTWGERERIRELVAEQARRREEVA